MSKRFWGFAVYLLPLLLLMSISGLKTVFPEKFEELSLKVFDQFNRLKPRAYKQAPVKFLDIDDESLKRLGQWPWPRTLVARMLEKLQESGAAAVALDILFAEPDRTSPAAILPLWADNSAVAALKLKADSLPDHDKILAKTIGQGIVITAFSLTDSPNPSIPLSRAGFAYAGVNPTNLIYPFRGAVASLSILEAEAAGNGSISFTAEKDGILRRIPLVFRLRNKLYPSLAAEALRAAQGATAYVAKSAGASGEMDFGEGTGLVSIKIGDFVVPTDSQGRIWLYDTGRVPERRIPVWKIFEKDFDSKSLEGAILFVGSGAAGLKDIRATALNPVSAGTEIHVQLVEQILFGDYLLRPDWAEGLEFVMLIAGGLLMILILPWLGAALSAIAGILFLGSTFYASWILFSKWHLLIDPVTPAVTSLILYLVVSLINYLRTESEKRHVRDAFSRYLSPALVEKLSSHPERLRLGGENKEMTVLFSDIRGFTGLSEKFSAAELTHFMNRYLTPMTDAVLKNQGTIDKYIGDCIMAFWNAPLDDSKHTEHAALTALEMMKRLEMLNQELEKESQAMGKTFQKIKIGVGVNTGLCSVGNMGSAQRFDYSVFGDDVNLASRLESLSKVYGAAILLGAKSRQILPENFACLELDFIRVKGKTQPEKIYALLARDIDSKPEFQKASELLERTLAAYRKQSWKESLEALEMIKGLKLPYFETEIFTSNFSERIREFEKNPPGPGWDGVFTALEK